MMELLLAPATLAVLFNSTHKPEPVGAAAKTLWPQARCQIAVSCKVVSVPVRSGACRTLQAWTLGASLS